METEKKKLVHRIILIKVHFPELYKCSPKPLLCFSFEHILFMSLLTLLKAACSAEISSRLTALPPTP